MDSSVILTHGSQILCFRHIHNGNQLWRQKFENLNTWKNFVIAHPSYNLAETCLDLVSPQMFWSISDHYTDLVTRLHVQIRLMGNLVSVHVYPGQLELMNLFVLFVKKLKTTYIIFFLFAPIFVTILIHFSQFWT